MSANKTGCFLCPIYDKGTDYKYGYELVESAIKYDILQDLFFVFSSEEQKKKFLTECQKKFMKQPGAVVLNKNLLDSKNPVTIKKFYGIWELHGRYDYIAPIDCECLFMQKTNAGKLFHDIWNKQTFLASNLSTVGADVVRKCAEALKYTTDKYMCEQMENFKYTWWFNEIPVYRSSDIEDFFAWMKEDNRDNIIYNEWNCFDYLVYVMWLVKYKGMHLKKYPYKDLVSVIESLWQPEKKNKLLIEKTIGTHWTSRTMISRGGFLDNPNVHIQFHRDRRSSGFGQLLGRIILRCKRAFKELLTV